MSIRRVTCPRCGTAANVPVAMANVKCPGCGTIWSVNQTATAPQTIPAPLQPSGSRSGSQTAGLNAPTSQSSTAASPELSEASTGLPAVMWLAGLFGGATMLLMTIGLIVFILSRQPNREPVAVVQVEETIKPSTPEPYREINLPEERRRLIYDDYRKVARTTVEKPLILPQGTRPRASLEDMLDKTFERELLHFAALHDITVADVKEVIKEGDAKAWDPSARSNAVRDGKRVYSKEMSEGWQPNPNRK